jgi:hypothetical protein
MCGLKIGRASVHSAGIKKGSKCSAAFVGALYRAFRFFSWGNAQVRKVVIYAGTTQALTKASGPLKATTGKAYSTT